MDDTGYCVRDFSGNPGLRLAHLGSGTGAGSTSQPLPSMSGLQSTAPSARHSRCESEVQHVCFVPAPDPYYMHVHGWKLPMLAMNARFVKASKYRNPSLSSYPHVGSLQAWQLPRGDCLWILMSGLLVRTVDALSAGQLQVLLCMARNNLYHLVLSVGDTGKNSHEKSSL
jgi:hypothetical protein